MKSNATQLKMPARFDPEIEFELRPRFQPLVIDSDNRRFERLKARLLRPVLRQTSNEALRRNLTLAANEAAAVAWTTPFPLLVLPVLLAEKTDEICQHAVRQEQVHEASHLLAEAAAL
jgi:hypothetical protein